MSAYGTISRCIPLTGNEKTGRTACTWQARCTCPNTCPMKGTLGCYGENPMLGNYAFDRMSQAGAAVNASPLDHILDEHRAILEACRPGRKAHLGRPIRLHVTGDCLDSLQARILAEAIVRWIEAGGGPAWTYTHSWRVIDREAWGPISVLGSIERPSEGPHVLARGYAPALIVSETETRKRFTSHGVNYTTCPAQTKGLTCIDCPLCRKSEKLAKQGRGIAFRAHGSACAMPVIRRILAEQNAE